MDTNITIGIIWVLIGGILVFWMQEGLNLVHYLV